MLDVLGYVGLVVSLLAFTFEGKKMRIGAVIGCSFFLSQAIISGIISLIISNVLFMLIHLFAIIRK